MLPLPVLGAVLFGSSGRDDSYITYWAADQLRRTGRITNYNGERIEQSSSLLHVLVLAAATLITRVPVTTLGPWIAVVAGALCAPVAYCLCRRFDVRGQWIAAALVATLPPLVYWSFGGLETSIATLLVLLSLALLASAVEGTSTSKVGIACAVVGVVLVRPEMGAVFFVALALAIVAVRFLVSDSWRGADGSDRLDAARRIAWAAAGVAACAVLIALFRRAYFGAWLPRPVSVKVGSANVQVGVRYTLDTVTQSLTIVAIVVGVIVLATRRRTLTPSFYLGGALVIVGTAAVIEPGGDWMEGGRLLTPWLAVAMVLVAGSLGRLSRSPRRALAGLLILSNVAGLVVYAASSSTGVAAWSHLTATVKSSGLVPASDAFPVGYWERRNAVHVRDTQFLRSAEPIFEALGRVVAPRPVVYASAQAGMVVYYLEKDAARRGHPFVFIDRNGLVDDTWDKCRHGVHAHSFGKPIPWDRVLSGECGRLPDVISRLSTSTSGRADRFKVADFYTTIAVQDDSVKPAAWPTGQRYHAVQWLAVRNDLVPALRAELQRDGQGSGRPRNAASRSLGSRK